MEKTATPLPPGTGLDLSKEKIVQFSIVVNDAERVAKRFSEIFGIAWSLYELSIDAPDCRLKLAVGSFGGRSLKLVQPLSGPSAHARFLEDSGEGFFTMGLGMPVNHGGILSALQRAGFIPEMQADAGDGTTFSILDTTEDLGCRIEFCGPAGDKGRSNIRQTGVVVPSGPPFVSLSNPVFSGGKRINQVGLVVRDEKKAARGFQELLGIQNWEYAYGPPGLFNATLNGKPVPESAMNSLDVAFAMGILGDIQIEIIRPVGIKPGGCHQAFLDKKGNGIQHLSFGIQPDYREFVEGMKKAGIAVEFGASIKDHGVSVSYLATQVELGGFQLEIVGKIEM